MTLIEGVGDEVTQFFVLVVVILVGIIAWWSTSIADQPLIRTVLILERRTRHRVPVEPPSAPATTTSSVDNSIDTGQLEPQNSADENQEIEDGAACQICDKEATNISSSSAASSSQNVNNDQDREYVEASNDPVVESNTSEYFQSNLHSVRGDGNSSEEGNQAIGPPFSSATSNTESNFLRSRRLAFFQSRQVTLLDSPATEGPILSTSSSTDSDNTDNDNTNQTQGPSVISSDASDNLPTTGNIRIRLKYLNDDQKLVEGRLHEQLGDFKRRHFGLELAADKLVRLIFNGQVLQSDSETLQGYGLFDNCVVHCLVHQQRSGSSNQAGASDNQSARDSASSSSNAADAAPHRDWDLGNVLFASLSLLLGLAWYCRYQYAQLFNATTTVALVGLTGILTVSLVGIYLPDQDGIRQ
ncbi:transmembrane and ubiquitin-like domain-containing protein 1 [Periplaneta americana]|uniref:transmembrane and ubiquitin-like domain-containing protein 1 n=1 Tax=Periplaneta americana TaxID=6978 RepID=UPI0037E94756